MSNGKLHIAPLERVIERLQEGLARYQADITVTLIRDGLIKRFELTYGLGHKMLQRYLECTSASPEQFNKMTFPDLIRTANERDLLLGDWPKWKEFRDMRARTSHAYDEKIALEVVAGIPQFLEEITYLRDQLRDRLP